MKNILKAEELAMLVLSVVFFSRLHYAWWWYPALFFAPDISMLGYLVNTRTGAYMYNFCHHRGVAVAVGMAGFYMQNELYLLASIILFGHAAFDRLLGFGLKYTDSFKHTHLGKL